jgi:hypothetical protein
MKKIPSFTIDHIRLLRGIYVSRKDEVNGEVITTFDIRMKEPNREPVLGQGALHTIEHLAATYLRNEPQWQEDYLLGTYGLSHRQLSVDEGRFATRGYCASDARYLPLCCRI